MLRPQISNIKTKWMSSPQQENDKRKKKYGLEKITKMEIIGKLIIFLVFSL